MRRSIVGAAGAALWVIAVGGDARASSGVDSPDNGVEQIGRGGAWVARADDPLATYFNPATLATQGTGVHLGVHLMMQDQCFTRLGPDGQPVPPSATTPIPGPGQMGGPEPDVCSEGGVFPNPQLAATFRVHDKLAIGLAVLGPHGVGNQSWPESVPYTSSIIGDTTQPAPQRYILVETNSTIFLPTLSVSFAPPPEISVGAGFVWGIATIDFVNFAEATSSPGGDDFNAHNDLRARLQAEDLFIPGFVLGALWSPMSRLDVGAWFKWQDAVRAKTDLYIESRYWTTAGVKNESPCSGPGEEADCNITDEKEAGTLKFQIPMEAKLGVRYHQPRGAGRADTGGRRIRDPLAEDLFDVEVDFTWANNSAVDVLEVRFRDGIPVRGTTVGMVPTNADVPHNWKDVVGVRLGGDFVVLPSLLALRAGGFFESKGQDDADLNLDFNLGWKLGVGGGATVRVGPVDLSAAFQHTFYGERDNGGTGNLKTLSGSATTDFRSVQSVNGGRLVASLNEVGLSGTLRF